MEPGGFDLPKLETFYGHGTMECNQFQSFLSQLTKLREALNPRDDSCCFTCFLPTKVCKGSLAAGGTCFAPDLVLLNWLLSKHLGNRLKAVDPFWYPTDILPAEWSATTFESPGWNKDLETEQIRASGLLWGLTKHLRGFWGQPNPRQLFWLDNDPMDKP
jgi:hypothetical protein